MILWIGPVLSALPMCVLSSIVVVVLRSLLMNFVELPKLFRVSKIDFVRAGSVQKAQFIWIVTFGATVCWDLIEGLLVGLAFSMFTVVLRSQWAKTRYMGLLEEGEYRDCERYSKRFRSPEAECFSKEPRFPVLSFESSLMFTNIEYFKDAVRKAAARTCPDMLSISRNDSDAEDAKVLSIVDSCAFEDDHDLVGGGG